MVLMVTVVFYGAYGVSVVHMVSVVVYSAYGGYCVCGGLWCLWTMIL